MPKIKKSSKYIQATFLIPNREDLEVGNGSDNPPERYALLHEILRDNFNGFNVSEGHYGEWQKTSKEMIPDLSKKYCVNLKRTKLKELITIVKICTVLFRQQSISFEYKGNAKLIWQNRCKQ